MSPKDKDGHEIKVQLGQGVFGQCVKKYYKGIQVAVKLLIISPLLRMLEMKLLLWRNDRMHQYLIRLV